MNDAELLDALLSYRHINTIVLDNGTHGVAVRNRNDEPWRYAYARSARDAARKILSPETTTPPADAGGVSIPVSAHRNRREGGASTG